MLKQQPDPVQRPRRLQSSQCAAGPSDIIGSVLSETSDLLNQGGVSWVIFLPHTCSDRCNALLRSPEIIHFKNIILFIFLFPLQIVAAKG